MLRIFAMNVTGQDFQGSKWRPYVSKRRLEEAKTRRRERERCLFLGAEALLNRSLEAVRGRTAPPAFYARNQYGKPYLPGADGLHVNWSHSGEYVLCAVADQEVGIDLQSIRAVPGKRLMQRVLQPEELLFCESLPAEEQKKQFYTYWAVKESYLKAIGTGFYTSLGQFYVNMDAGHPQIIQRGAGEACECRLLTFVDPAYAAAVCCLGRISGVSIEYLEPA